MHGGVVDKESMRLFSMLSQALTVIAAKHDQRVLINSFFFQKTEQPPHLFIRKSNFAVVRLCRILAAVRLRRMVRKMRIIEMHPQEKLLLRILSQPVQRLISYNIARTLHLV